MIFFCWLIYCIAFSSVAAYHKKTDRNQASTINLVAADSLTVADCRRCLVIIDQAEPAIDIVDVGRGGKIVWAWKPAQSNIAANKASWFTAPDDAKPVYGKRYLLINASGGGVALIRIADKKAVFYAYAGKNPHSSELLPDGNIAAASSTDNRLVIFHVDTVTIPNSVYKKVIPLPFAHNVVWDRKRQVLWSAGDNHLYKFRYNFNCKHPDLILKDSLQLSGNDAHDLFPVYGKDFFWLTTLHGVYTISMKTKNISAADFKYADNIKSVSSGPNHWPTVIMKPKTNWWSDKVLDIQGDTVFQQTGMKIYKARWFLENRFSYPGGDKFKVCP